MWCIELPNGSYAFPFAKTSKLVHNGLAGGDSIVSFYDIAVRHLATGKLQEMAERDQEPRTGHSS